MGAHVIAITALSTGIFTRLVPVSRSRCFCFRSGGPHPGSSHSRFVPSSAPIDCLATIRTQEPPGTQSLGGNSLGDRLPTGSIWLYLFFGECLGGGKPLISLKMRYSFPIS
jgi:hypothetical protein